MRRWEPDIQPCGCTQKIRGFVGTDDKPFRVMPLATEATADRLRVKAGVFYAGIVGGCSCADDPTPLESQPEYCMLWFEIDRSSGAARVELAPED